MQSQGVGAEQINTNDNPKPSRLKAMPVLRRDDQGGGDSVPVLRARPCCQATDGIFRQEAATVTTNLSF
jgi:hypothetical protein